MPKRKRSDPTSSTTTLHNHLSTNRKAVQRALKTAKGFERQKLSKRLKHATEKEDAKTVKRIGREIEALRGLNVEELASGYLRRCLGKVKAVREGLMGVGMGEWIECGVLKGGNREKTHFGDEGIREEDQPGKGQVTETNAIEDGELMMAESEKQAALHNVTSNMYNAAVVRDCVAKIMTGIHLELGIPVPALNGKKKDSSKKPEAVLKSALKNGNSKTTQLALDEILEEVPREDDGEPNEPSWEGFDSGDENAHDAADQNNDDLDDEDFSHYDHLIGASSDEESFDEKEYDNQHPSKRHKRASISVSPSPSLSDSQVRQYSISPSPIPPPSFSQIKSIAAIKSVKLAEPSKSTSQPSTAPLPKPFSTFLPTLYGGYFSGSSSASSLSDDDNAASSLKNPVKKNRPGQTARRAIWEKKYGERANHIKSGQGAVSERGSNSSRKGRDGRGGKGGGWDARKGARPTGNGEESRSGSYRSSGSGGGAPGVGDGSGRGAGENTTQVEAGKRGMGRKDDVGVLHPSWQAAKKAKEKEKGAATKFEGKKVVFD